MSSQYILQDLFAKCITDAVCLYSPCICLFFFLHPNGKTDSNMYKFKEVFMEIWGEMDKKVALL